MLSSLLSTTNKVSYFISLAVYALLLVPAELPGDAMDTEGGLLQWLNPMSAVNYFLSESLMNNRAVGQFWTWLISSFMLALMTMFLLAYLGSKLRARPGMGRGLWARVRRAIGLLVIAGSMIISLRPSSVSALPANLEHVEGLDIFIQGESIRANMDSTIQLDAVVINHGLESSSSLLVAINIIDLNGTRDVIDLEEWTTQRTQSIDTLAPGRSVRLRWTVNTILEGDYMVYMVLFPGAGGTETTGHPVTSPGIHLTVTPLNRLKPVDVLPVAVGEPLLLLVITYFVYRRRRQQIDLGGLS
jgi:hypothetical protein